MSKWNKICSPDPFIQAIKENSFVNECGNLCYSLDVKPQLDNLYTLLNHDFEMFDDLVLFGNFLKAFADSISDSKNNTKNEFNSRILNHFDAICRKQLALSSKYVLVTSLNVSNEFKFKTIQLNGCRLSFHATCPQKYLKFRKLQIDKINNEQDLSLSHASDILTVVIYLKAPDYKSACKQGLLSLDYFRALCNLGFRKKISIRYFDEKYRYDTSSKIKLGQVHTVHLPTGHIAGDLAWYEPEYQGGNKLLFRDFDKTTKNLNFWINKIKKSPYASHLINALSLYINSLDTLSSESRFLRLWVAFEYLLKTSDAEILARRISFLFKGNSTRSEILILKNSRNSTLHQGTVISKVDFKIFRLLTYFENTFKFICFNHYKFQTVEEILEFISSPTDNALLAKRINYYKHALAFNSTR